MNTQMCDVYEWVCCALDSVLLLLLVTFSFFYSRLLERISEYNFEWLRWSEIEWNAECENGAASNISVWKWLNLTKLMYHGQYENVEVEVEEYQPIAHLSGVANQSQNGKRRWRRLEIKLKRTQNTYTERHKMVMAYDNTLNVALISNLVVFDQLRLQRKEIRLEKCSYAAANGTVCRRANTSFCYLSKTPKKYFHQHWNESQTPNAFPSNSRTEPCISDNKSKTIKIRYFSTHSYYEFRFFFWSFLTSIVTRKRNWTLVCTLFMCTRTSNGWRATFINLLYHCFPFFFISFEKKRMRPFVRCQRPTRNPMKQKSEWCWCTSEKRMKQ